MRKILKSISCKLERLKEEQLYKLANDGLENEQSKTEQVRKVSIATHYYIYRSEKALILLRGTQMQKRQETRLGNIMNLRFHDG